MLIDTHCHLNMLLNTNDHNMPLGSLQEARAVDQICTESQEHGVSHFVTISTTRDSIYHNISYAQQSPHVSAVAGLHPCDYGTNWKSEIQELRSIISEPSYAPYIVAVGECGLDFHHSGYDAEEQRSVFKAQIEIALEHDLPIVVHSRKATQEALRIIEPYLQDGLRGVIHCYAGDAALAREIRDTFGFYIGIDGPVTYPKNDELRNAVSEVGIEHILLETDAPFLPPQEIRGKRNHPLYTRTIAQRVADILYLSVHEVAQNTSANARALFNIQDNG